MFYLFKLVCLKSPTFPSLRQVSQVIKSLTYCFQFSSLQNKQELRIDKQFAPIVEKVAQNAMLFQKGEWHEQIKRGLKASFYSKISVV